MAKNRVASVFAELVQPSRIDAWTPLNYTPTEKQRIFHDISQQRVNNVLFGGAAGGGKSCSMMMEAIDCAMNYPGMSIACIRRTYNELEESFIKELRKRGYAKALGAKWNQTKFTLTFLNGSVINFTYAENEIDASRIQGGEYQLICIDEASLMSPAVVGMIAERLRSGDKNLPVIGLRLATNPGGIGSKDLRDKYIAPTDWGKAGVITGEDGQTYCYIHSNYKDNPYIDKGYEKVLNAIADPNRRRAMRDGDWDAMVGAFFPQYTRLRHTVPYFTPPMEWQRYCGIDYGIHDPFAAIWAAVDNDGRIWVYREIVMPGVQAQDQAKAIVEAEEAAGETNVVRVADPSMWGDRGTPLSIADVYGINGCGIAKADNNRLTGYSRFHEYLNETTPCEYHTQLGLGLADDENPWLTCPKIHFMDSCPNIIEDMPNLPRSKLKPEDSETRGVNDHSIDACRYLVAMAGTSARPVIYNDRPIDDAALRTMRDEAASAFTVPAHDPTKLVSGKFAGTLAYSY